MKTREQLVAEYGEDRAEVILWIRRFVQEEASNA